MTEDDPQPQKHTMPQGRAVSVRIPIRLLSEGNVKEHWALKSKRQKRQKGIVRVMIKPGLRYFNLPATVTLTRLAPRTLDEDNLLYAFKHIRDEIADILIPGLAFGRADGDPRITWRYGQTKERVFAISIEIVEHPTPRIN